MRDILYLSHRIPYPPNKGDKIRAYHVLDFLRHHFRVHLGCFVDDEDDWQHCEQLRSLCASTCFVALKPAVARIASLRGYASGEALSLAYYRSRQLQQWVGQTLAVNRIDTALAFSGPMGQYLPARTAHGPLRRIMDLVDVDSEKWRDYADSRPWPLSLLYRREAARLLAAEQAIASRFDHVTLVSAAEAALFRLRAPGSSHKVSFFSNGVDAGYFRPDPLRNNPYTQHEIPLVFTGAMDYWPNVQAVQWFAHEVLPSVRLQWPEANFHIVGARPAPSVAALGRLSGVKVSGTVPDVRPYLQHAALVVAPLRIARGIQNKVLEAMAMQKAVVATPQALEGISAAGKEVLCAAGAGEFVHHLLALLADGDGDVARQMGAAARARVLSDYSWQRNLAKLGRLLGVDAEDAAARTGAGCGAAPP
jgi:sugar transferase (PEP-CTERM/EpsH1 system associated)